MTIDFQAGYTKPGADLPLTHARILHDGNRIRPQVITASAELGGYPGFAADRGDTVDRWRPFENTLGEQADPALGGYVAFNTTYDPVTRILTDNTNSSQHTFSLSGIPLPAGETVFGVRVRRRQSEFVRITAGPGNLATFNLFTGTVVSSSATVTAGIAPLGGDRFELRINVALAASIPSALLQVNMLSPTGSAVYVGGSGSVVVERFCLHSSLATLAYDTFQDQSCDVFALAAHNLGSGAGRISFQQDSNRDGVWSSIGDLEPSTDAPIFFIFSPISSSRWRIQVSRAVLPEIGVFRVGKLLQMERPIYGGVSPARMNRNTEVLGNMSGTGQLLGRSRKRTTLSANFSWSNLTYPWVRANLDGPEGLIQSAEVEPAFIAWRPDLVGDVDYLMRAATQAPAAMGTRNLWSFAMSGEALSYE